MVTNKLLMHIATRYRAFYSLSTLFLMPYFRFTIVSLLHYFVNIVHCGLGNRFSTCRYWHVTNLHLALQNILARTIFFPLNKLHSSCFLHKTTYIKILHMFKSRWCTCSNFSSTWKNLKTTISHYVNLLLVFPSLPLKLLCGLGNRSTTCRYRRVKIYI